MSTKLIKRCDRCQEEVEEFGTINGSDSNRPSFIQPPPFLAPSITVNPNANPNPRYSLSRVETYPQQASPTPIDLCDKCSHGLHLFLKGRELQ